MNRIVLLAMVVALAVGVSGCVTYSAGIAPSTKPLAPDGYTVSGTQTGTSWGVNILGIPFCQAKTQEALSEALKFGGADALINVTVDNRAYYLAVVYLQRISVEGLAVKEKIVIRDKD